MHTYFMAPLCCPAAMRRKAGALCGGYYATKGNIAQDGDVVTCPQCIAELRRHSKTLRGCGHSRRQNPTSQNQRTTPRK